MDLTTPLIAFLFVCLIFPKIVRNRPQFYISFGLLVLILLLNIVGRVFPNDRFIYFLSVIIDVLRLVVFILLVLCAGGLSLHELTGEVFRSFEVMRRGDTEKTVIIPLTGQKPKVKEEPDEPVRQSIETPTSSPPDSNRSIPLEEPRHD
ncbi:MAG TPA: hypothetical protein VGP99_08695 [Tepidisphaeraceae bacterium]|jgi:hypothetical protein|nr:hypothetical protein [Tepidisphaeraceae bacterium]